jgi:hypothetical protein
MEGMNYVFHFSRLNVLCFQQRKFLERKGSTMRSAIIRKVNHGNWGVGVACGWELRQIHRSRGSALVAQYDQTTHNQDGYSSHKPNY